MESDVNSTSQTERFCFPKQRRMLKTDEFQRAFKSGCYAADQILVCNTNVNGLDYSRLGLSISRKVGNAVVRNRWKRAIREAFRQQFAQLPRGFDFVIRPKAGASFDAEAVRKSLPKLTHRAVKRLPPNRKSPAAGSSQPSTSQAAAKRTAAERQDESPHRQRKGEQER